MPLQHDHGPEAEARSCRHCGGPIIGRRPQAQFCSVEHQRAAEHRRYALRHKARLAAYRREYRKRKALEAA